MDLLEDKMKSIAHIQILQDKLAKKIVEIEESDVVCDLRVWMTEFRKMIGEGNEKVQDLIVSTDPVLMKECTNMLVDTLSPRVSDTQTKTDASKLLYKMSKGWNDHYDKQE